MARLPWFKWFTEVRSDPKLLTLTDAQFRVWVNLMCLAGEQSTRGVIAGYGDKLLAVEVSRGDVDLMKQVRQELAELRIITVGEDGSITFLNWKARQQTKPSDDPARVKQRVDKHRNGADVTRYGALQVGCNAKNAIEEEVEEELETTTHTAPARGADWPKLITAVEHEPLRKAVLAVVDKTEEFRRGFSPNHTMEFGKTLQFLIREKQAAANVNLYGARLPSWLNKIPEDVNPPSFPYFRKTYFQVLNHEPPQEQRNGSTRPTPPPATTRGQQRDAAISSQMDRIAERERNLAEQRAARAAQRSGDSDGGTGGRTFDSL